MEKRLKEMEEKKQKQVSPTWVFIIAGVLIALIGPLCIYLGMQLGKDDNEGTNNNVIDNQTVNNTINNNSTENNIDSNITKLMDNLFYYSIDRCNIKTNFLVDKKFTASDFKNEELFSLVYSKRLNPANLLKTTFTASTVMQEINSLFGSNHNFKHESFHVECTTCSYDVSKAEYTCEVDGCGCVGPSFDTTWKYTAGYAAGNEAIVEFYVLFAKPNDDNYYKDFKLTN